MAKSRERPMGEQDHAAWQKAILLWFAKHEREWNVEALPEYRVQVSLTRFRVPDVSVIDFASPSQLVATSLAAYPFLARSIAVTTAFALLTDSSYSFSGTESATMPAPAWMYPFLPWSNRVRMAMQLSRFPEKSA